MMLIPSLFASLSFFVQLGTLGEVPQDARLLNHSGVMAQMWEDDGVSHSRFSLDGGSTFNGHAFDLGKPVTILFQIPANPTGMGSFGDVVPSGAFGRTVYFEVAGLDSTGTLADSNMMKVTIN